MRILLIGNGAREHALAKKLAESAWVEKIYVAPGNGGTAREPKCQNLAVESQKDLLNFAREQGISFTVVGPEAPLIEGIVDAFQEEGLFILGPHQAAAALEGSKSFAKDFMIRHGIKTAAYQVFHDAAQAKAHLQDVTFPVVIKADGLAQGKGVEIVDSREAGEAVLDSFMVEGRFQEASRTVVIEEYLTGKEASIITLYDGERIVVLNSSMDHKKVFEGETGPNTGGMGSLTPNPYFHGSLAEDFQKNILEKTLAGLQAEGLQFKGVIFFGLMMNEKGAYLLEYNLRFGDPETQGILELLEGDLCTIFEKTLKGELKETDIQLKPGKALAVVLAAKGYPGTYKKDIDITAFFTRKFPQVSVLAYASHGQGERMLSSSGRVLTLVTHGEGEAPFTQIEKVLHEVVNPDLFSRRDIGRI